MVNVLFMKNMTNQSTSNYSQNILENLLQINLSPMENKEFEKELQNKFFCPSRFAQEVEEIVKTNPDMNYIEAIITLCEMNSIELESVPKLLSKPLKEKIKCDAMELNFLKKTSKARLVF